ncbi:hypothetical protein L0128_21170 [candidate division KSB1 bacterium]|nr:hypothetical protein [candidate division KSB1 bacterium]
MNQNYFINEYKIVFQLLLLLFLGIISCAQKNQPGDFKGTTNMGDNKIPGSVEFNETEKIYRVTGSGENIWGTSDAFYFVWQKAAGDLCLSTEIMWEGAGKHPHRKAGWMVRQDLSADAPYIDAVVHGDSLISLQFRREKGGDTQEIKSPIKAPAVIRLERHGDLFSLAVARPNHAFQPVGSLSIPLVDSVYAGLVVCSHDSTTNETAIFSKVELDTLGIIPEEKRITQSTLEIIDILTRERKIIYQANEHFEAPNWSPDGQYFIINSNGKLFTIPVGGGTPQILNTDFANNCNNDHGLSPDGKMLAISHSPEGQSIIYTLPATGGIPKQITPLGPSYWHGWSPDGKILAYCAERNNEYDVYTIPVEGGKEKRLTTAPGLDDGPEYSPDGQYIYFNSVRTGLMKIWRMRPDGTQQEQVTFDADYNDWFAHPSPDGKWLVFVSYDKSVSGHPRNKDVVLRLMPVSGGEPEIIAHLFGGQGTINVPSWSPDSRQVAFVRYQMVKGD